MDLQKIKELAGQARKAEAQHLALANQAQGMALAYEQIIRENEPRVDLVSNTPNGQDTELPSGEPAED